MSLLGWWLWLHVSLECPQPFSKRQWLKELFRTQLHWSGVCISSSLSRFSYRRKKAHCVWFLLAPKPLYLYFWRRANKRKINCLLRERMPIFTTYSLVSVMNTAVALSQPFCHSASCRLPFSYHHHHYSLNGSFYLGHVGDNQEKTLTVEKKSTSKIPLPKILPIQVLLF